MSKKLEDEQNWGEPIDMAEYGRTLAKYIEENGPIPVPRNSGARRTESKKALLAAIDDAAAKKGFRW